MASDRIRQALAQIGAKPDPERLTKIVELAKAASDAAEMRRTPLEPILDELEALTGHREDIGFWASFHGGNGPQEFAEIIGTPVPEAISDLTQDEIRALLAFEAQSREAVPYDGAVSIRLHSFMSVSLGGAFTPDLIYWPYDEWGLDDLTAEIEKRRSALEVGGTQALRQHEVSVARNTLAMGTAPAHILSVAMEMLEPDEQSAYEEVVERKFAEEIEAAHSERRASDGHDD